LRTEDPLNGPSVRELRNEEIGAAAAVLGRGMRDNPIHERVFGADPEHREVALRRLFSALLAQDQRKGAVLGAFTSDTLLGVCALVPPGRCQPVLRERMALLGALARNNSPGSVLAALLWSSCWARQDLSAPHWHLGPLGVDRDRQRQGIGSALLEALGEHVDSHHGLAYLETDKKDNVPFYERFGFAVTAESTVLGVPCWFMVRPRSTRESNEVNVVSDEGDL
jgi:ribosomal protein S18 acetylase RimI-like enzyme